ncbi:UvrD-helicase domain-containing protein [Vibrio alginolyticus]
MIDISNEDINVVEKVLDVTFDEIRKQIIISYDDVQACPGSGKTTIVAAKLLILAKKWKEGQQGICVLTHTNVAKNEIVGRLKQSVDGEKLLSFPHFIGTIQEFVNKFLAIPYLRSSGYKINQIDDETCCNKGWSYLKIGTRNYLQRKHISSLHGMEYKLVNGDLELAVPSFREKSQSNSYLDLVRVKNKLMNDGYFYYHEMYAFAQHYILSNSSIKDAIQFRFPIVFIDEMQDTQKFQDEFLNDLFLDESVKLQRFGDPDQAIYSVGEEGNQTYNQVILDKVENSHRFNNSIALLARNLSYNRINLNSEIEVPEQTLHTIFLVDDNSRGNVFEKFAMLCSQVVPEDCKRKIKTVGAVGVHKDNGLSICKYFKCFDKNNSSDKFKPSQLIHYFYQGYHSKTWYEAYRLVLEGLVRCGRIANAEIKYKDGTKSFYSIKSIRKYLKEFGLNVDFNTIVRTLIVDDLSEEMWNQSVITLFSYFDLPISDEIKKFIIFHNNRDVIDGNDQEGSSNTICIDVGGRVIENEVATIHSVKGETHSATLVLETKFHSNDVGGLIDYILNENTDKPIAKRKIKFMKQLYVAFSRPEHLLCVAMDKSGFPPEHVGKAEYAGWKIQDLTQV